MNETKNINSCERAGELVAYFYKEATPDERASFDAHLSRCAACRDELGAFAGVREAVGHWRAEILSAAPASLANAAAQATTPVRNERAAPVSSRASSALAALREFFTLSPVWMRAGTVAAALVVCALAALAVVNAEVRWENGGVAFSTRLRNETKPAPPVDAPAAKVDAQAELDNLRAERDAALRELEDTRAQLDDSRAANLIAAVETLEPVSDSSTKASTPNNSRRERRTVSTPNARQPQRLRSRRDEEYVPRLYDLLIEAN
ncbi:MAG TPA: zf-HC2 domain-containing protein [Pyrinomonadaceae bacterium]|jgi:hypothetical protein|nr:zf-HC2 domain-containing protein [Pyrinomonadaceae bacterium]